VAEEEAEDEERKGMEIDDEEVDRSGRIEQSWTHIH
jgi:hypothetical protein